MIEYQCFLCGADDTGIDLHEYDLPNLSEMRWCCSECLSNGDVDEFECDSENEDD